MSVSLTSLNVCYPLVEAPLFYVLLISKICYQLNYALWLVDCKTHYDLGVLWYENGVHLRIYTS